MTGDRNAQTSSRSSSLEWRICEAIRSLSVLEFEYEGRHRVVHPYCHGMTSAGFETLRAIQVEGESRAGGFGYGKLWTVAKMSHLRTIERRFQPEDPDYNPDDSAMVEIHCRVKRKVRD